MFGWVALLMAVFALLGYFAISALSWIYPANDSLVRMCESSFVNTIAAGCFSLVGGAIAYLLTQSPVGKATVIEDSRAKNLEAYSTYSDAVHQEIEALNGDVADLKQRLESKTIALTHTRSVTRRLRDFAVVQLAFRFSYISLIWFAALTLFAAIAQGATERFKTEGLDLAEPVLCLSCFIYSLLMAAFAYVLGLVFMSRFSKKTSRKGARYCFIIGAMPPFVAGVVSLLQFSPELLALAWRDADNAVFYNIPYLNIPLIAWLAVSRFVIFPLVGFFAAWTATWSVKRA